jgi:hypothetical protein
MGIAATLCFTLQEVLGRMVTGLHLNVSAKVLGHPDPRMALRAALHAWLPLPEAVLGMAVEHLPDPAVREPGCGA